MGAFSGEQRPGAADAGAVKGGAVFVFAIAVAVVAIPAGALRQLDGQQGVDGANRIHDARVVGGTQAEANQCQRVGADDVVGAFTILAAVLVRRTVLDGNEALCGGRGRVSDGRGDADVVAVDAKLLGQIASGGVN